MYGTIARAQVKPGEFEDVLQMIKTWEAERRPSVKGALHSFIYRADADENTLLMAIVFSDRDSYHANADDPAQDKWYQEFRSHLTGDPEWMDGEIVHAS